MYKVYQAKVMPFPFSDAKNIFVREDYDLVAVVEAEGVEDIFRITNHIDSDWTKNPEVVELFKTPCRSTSVGDVVEDPEGNLLYCASFGWEPMRSE